MSDVVARCVRGKCVRPRGRVAQVLLSVLRGRCAVICKLRYPPWRQASRRIGSSEAAPNGPQAACWFDRVLFHAAAPVTPSNRAPRAPTGAGRGWTEAKGLDGSR